MLLVLMYSFQGTEFLKGNLKDNLEEKSLKYKVFQLCYCLETINLALYLNSLIDGKFIF